jgi:hypothetical protein
MQKPPQSREYKTEDKMLEELYMQDLANAMRMPEEVVPAGTVTVSAPDPEMAGMDKAFVGTRLNVPAPGQPTQQDREKMAIGLLDTLAGALRGAAAQVGGLPGDIRSILDMINQEGAEKYLGQRSFATTEEILADTSVRIPSTQIDVPFPPVLKEGVPNREERQKSVETAQEVGTFLPAPGVPEAVIQGGKLVGKAIKATKNMPVGMSTQAVGQGMDELGFYSAAKQAVDAIQQPKGTGAQFLAQISKTPGVKPDEIKWTGLDEFLAGKKSVTKAEVQEYLDKNRVEIKEVQLRDPSPEDVRAFMDDEAGQGMSFDEALDYLKNDEGMTKFSKYTLPGGENYREILLTLPEKPSPFKTFVRSMGEKYGRDTPRNQWSPEDNSTYDSLLKGSSSEEQPFRSGHFDQPNILAHLRVNDRVIDGKKTLFVEEVQSDWHQAGRKRGYGRSEPLTAAEDKEYKELADIGRRNLSSEQSARLTELSNKDAKYNSPSVPDAPFKTTWSDLSMKRVIQMASEGGYDRIAFTTGKTQAERFDLSKQINDLTVTRRNTDFNISATDKDGKPAIMKTVQDLRNLDEVIGKDLANKVKDDFANKSGNEHTYSGLDLQVGGEGMKGFYDDILPKFLDKYAKKWDAKTGVTEIEVGKGKPTNYANFDEYQKAPASSKVPVNYIDVTPKMRESVVTKGQPMFAIGAGGAGAAVTQEENK